MKSCGGAAMSAALVHVHKNRRKNVAQIDGKQRGKPRLGGAMPLSRVSDLRFFFAKHQRQLGK